MNKVERLQFIVKFAQQDLSKARPGDLLNLQEDLSHVLPDAKTAGAYEWVCDTVDDPEIGHYPKPKIIELQKVLQGLLPDKISGWDWASAQGSRFKMPTLVVDGVPGGVLCIKGNFRDMFLATVLNLLSDPAVAEAIRVCLECRTVFVRVRRQKYCSGPCVDKANKREWLKTEQGQKYLQKTRKGAKRGNK